jgi:sec-independent protein translocase protein TatA
LAYENVVLVIIVVVIILFGAKRLPQLARGFARAQHEFEKARREVRRENGTLDNALRNNRRDQLESVASKLEIDDISSLSDDELQNKILSSISRDNERHTTSNET